MGVLMKRKGMVVMKSQRKKLYADMHLKGSSPFTSAKPIIQVTK